MDNLNKSLGKVSIGVPPKPPIFTFVPVVRKLPVGSVITEEEKSGRATGERNKIRTGLTAVPDLKCHLDRRVISGSHESFAVSHEGASAETMSDSEIFKVEKVFIRDCVQGGAGNTAQPGTKLQFKPSLQHVTLSQTKACPAVSAQSENMLNHVSDGTASMKTAADKHGDVSQRHSHDTSGLSEGGSGFFVNRACVSEDRASPTNTADLFPTPASSRESILSECWDRERSWSGVQPSSVASPATLSRTVSPCSSVLSGIFSPAVVPVRRHYLAPGSSLMSIPQTCFSSCDSLSSSACPQSPPPPRHRPPLTRLSLLTAILRKGRLPVLTPALQRPYTPCWPVNPVTLSFCAACSAASSVASIPLEFSSRFPSSASIDSHAHTEAKGCVAAPPPAHSNEHSDSCPQARVKRCSEQISVPRWQQVISPPPVRSGTLPTAPPPLLCSDFKSVPPPKHAEIPSRKAQHTHVSISRSPELNTVHTHLRSHTDNNPRKLISPSSKVISQQETSPLPPDRSHLPNSSLSKLHSLSQQLRSPPTPPPPPPPQLQPSPSPAITRPGPASPLPPLRDAVGGREAGRGCLKNTTPSQAFPRAPCLSPSRYAHVVSSGRASPAGSPTPTPSPAPPFRDLTPSPSLSVRSTPSPRPGSGISDCGDREGKKRKTHKIKLSYKSLAAIPTNTLLLDQQAIDEQVERSETPCDALSRGATPDPHAEMCSPAQLRQQSEELYAVIDEILANSIPPSLQSSRSSTPISGLQNNSSLPKSLGRETKYASLCSLHPSTGVERNSMDPKKSLQTKPGVIRPMTAIPRLTLEEEDEFHANPFRQSHIKQTLSDNRKVRAGQDFNMYSKGQTLRGGTKPESRTSFSMCDLQITEPGDQIGHPVKDASASFSPAERRMEAFETHI